ncbi:uncharacterized protein LOC121736188 [Aricia agestis]|uniref:uncharacterized protein LOC121736188 n=1 Tax=Aricia agestis TaxID=91739 RepID=UPI001C20432A|nr:uncharacterized protein LOC121736188 [Aricia agestis]
MRKKFSLFLFLLIISNDIVYGKHRNRSKSKAETKHGATNSKANNRLKRSLLVDVEQKGNAEKRKYFSDPKLEKDPPFWGNRGRRDSSEVEDVASKYFNNDDYHKFKIPNYNLKREDDEDTPFWGNRGRRNSEESEEMLYNLDNSIYKERRQEDDPFWGTRGRREDSDRNYIIDTNDPPFWGNRGRREESEPYWGNRGRREESEPFWGNRGRRQENDPFWANRGRREAEAVMDSRGKKKLTSRMILNDESEPFWGNRGRRRLKIRNSILKAIYDVKESLDSLIEQRYDGNNKYGSKTLKTRISPEEKFAKLVGNELVAKKPNQKSVLDDRIYAEEPHYIIVERSSRSSGEFDPFYISRGKKFSNLEFTKAIPNRRGALEDLVKSVRNDPFYIARGKKDSGNTTASDVIDKNVFCMILEQMLNKKVKREVPERSDRDRRTILKNLALKLQMDPYYVSRGKKDSEEKDNFIDRIVAKCNST